MDERQRRREEALRRKAEARERKLAARQRKIEAKKERIEAKRELVESRRELVAERKELAAEKRAIAREEEERQAIVRADEKRAEIEARVGPTIHPGEPEPEPVFGGEAYVVDMGPKDAPAVVMVHGVGDNAARDWDGLIPLLKDDFRVLTFDLPGFGRSTKANVIYKPDTYIKFIKYVVDSRLGRPFNLVGHSMGGAISLGYAGTYLGDVERLIIADAAGILHRHAFGEYMIRLGITNIPGWDTVTGNPTGSALGSALGGLVETFAHKYIRPYFRHEPDPSKLFELETTREKLLGGDPLKISGLFLISKNFGPAISSIGVAPLLVWGGEDKIAPLRTGKMLSSWLHGARFEVLEGCGHVPMREHKERFNELVLEHLSRPPEPLSERPAVDPASLTGTERMVNESSKVVTGRFGELVMGGCENVTLRGVEAAKMKLTGCGVTMEDCRIAGGEIGLDVADSRVKVTGGSISGDVAIWSERSDLDLAGTRIEGRGAAVRSGLEAEVLFSICPVESPRNRGFLHGVYLATPTEDI